MPGRGYWTTASWRGCTGRVVTRWSDNRAFEEKPGTLLINPGEHVDYSETIATRELTPGRVFTVEVILPAYPELDGQRKSIAARNCCCPF